MVLDGNILFHAPGREDRLSYSHTRAAISAMRFPGYWERLLQHPSHGAEGEPVYR